ncbi:hypothetical protein D3Z38_17290 [Clostridiales bacterium]|nr:hypothetical protein [Clostridiales bacterium]
MKKIFSKFFVAMIVVTMMIPNTVSAKEKQDDQSVAKDGNYIVLLEDEKTYEKVISQHEDDLANTYEEYDNNLIAMDMSAKEAKALKEEQGVLSVEENIMLNGLISEEEDLTGLSELLEESDITYADLKGKKLKQWYRKAIGLKKNQNFSKNQGDVKIELLDSGVSHTDDIDIKGRENLIPNEEGGSVLFEDASGHGTSLAGIIGAKDNEAGITGINPNANIFSVKVMDARNKATLNRVIEGIYWGIENKMNIINMSFGTTVNSPALRQAVQDADAAGILLIAAAGNDDSRNVQYPAAYPEVMAVGATDTTGKQMEEFATGEELEILAPGDGILGTGLFDGVVMSSGTSMSAAEITGVASLIWAKDPTKSADFIKELMKRTGKNVSNASAKELKLVDVKKAFQAYDKFERSYVEGKDTHGAAIENKAVSESHEDALVLNGLWTAAKHKDIVTAYLNNEDTIGSAAFSLLNSNRVKIMAETAYQADYDFKTAGSGLHGTGNYIQSCKFLFNCAQKVREGTSVASAVSSASSGLGAANMTAMNNLVSDTKKMLNTDMSGISSDETNPAVRYFKVLGFATHCIADTFAHRAYVREGDLGAMDKKDFKSFTTFENAVKSGKVEYRDVVDYTSISATASRGKYEDKPEVAPRRFKDAKKGSAKLLKASLLKTGFSASWIRNPEFGTTLEGQSTYAE